MAEIERVKELRHRRVMERQISKFHRLLLEKDCKDQGGSQTIRVAAQTNMVLK